MRKKHNYLLFIIFTIFLLLTSEKVEHTDESNYKTIIIGQQIWMAENLNENIFRTGEKIPCIQNNKDWEIAGKMGMPAWCYYNNTEANGMKYGKLYNGYAMKDPRGLAPKGWHIATDSEWTVMINYLGGIVAASNKLKSISGWLKEEGNGNNISGFNALPGGWRRYDGDFNYAGNSAFWYADTKCDTSASQTRSLYLGSIGKLCTDNMFGFSIRCIKD